MTYDNGKEFAYHMEIAKVLKANGYFAHPYHSWERGLNENTNGLIRQYLPKGTDFNKLTDKQVLEIMDKLNNRPRKCLGYKTPNQVFFGIKPNVINLVPNSLFCLKISSIQHHLKESDMSLVPAVPTTDQAVFQKII